MKYDEFHRIVMSNGWMKVRQTGSHIIYRKNGKSYPVPYHKGRELGKGLAERMKKEMGLC